MILEVVEVVEMVDCKLGNTPAAGDPNLEVLDAELQLVLGFSPRILRVLDTERGDVEEDLRNEHASYFQIKLSQLKQRLYRGKSFQSNNCTFNYYSYTS